MVKQEDCGRFNSSETKYKCNFLQKSIQNLKANLPSHVRAWEIANEIKFSANENILWQATNSQENIVLSATLTAYIQNTTRH